jgi:hypothetical protein
MLTEHYETLRGYALCRNSPAGLRWGQGAMMARGMAAWIEAVRDLIPVSRPEPSPSRESVPVPLLVERDVIELMGEAVLALLRRGSL